jgi:hypothetical protein
MTNPPNPETPYSAGGRESAYGGGADQGYGQTYGQGYGQTYGQSVPQSYGTGQSCPPSNVGWAVAAIICFWPLSFVAMTRALDVYPLWAQGRHAEAQAASATAKKLGQISLWIVLGLIVLYIAFLVVMVGVAATGY